MKPFANYTDADLERTFQNYQDDPPTTPAAEKRLQDLVAEMTDRGLFQGTGRRSAPNAVHNHGRIPAGSGARIGRGPDGDWESMGHFAMAVKMAAQPGGHIDPRLVANAPSTYSQEGIGADGGFSVPPDFRTEIWQKVNGEDSLLSMTDQLPTTSNQIVVPADEQPPWSSSGPQAVWEPEAGQLTQSKVSLQDKTIRLNKLAALLPISEELREDAPGLDGYLRKKIPQIFTYRINYAIARGTGAGMPLGFLNSPALKSVAAESGQGADSIVFGNVINMFNAMDPAAIDGACWLCTPAARPQLMQMQYPGGSGQVFPLFLPGGSLAGKPFSTLLGLPIYFHHCLPELGDAGDICLVNMRQYMTAVKSAGMRADVSMHLFFDFAVAAYRFILRIAGQPWPAAPITAPDGVSTYSPFVCLDERA